ncbi:hypothetical protein [Pandoraea faecigallinarum]|nr:hypothetical protein [Pandoraea faecigallinarum]
MNFSRDSVVHIVDDDASVPTSLTGLPRAGNTGTRAGAESRHAFANTL